MQISDQFESLTLQIGCGACILFTLGFIFVKLIALLTGSHLLGIFIFILAIYKLLKSIAIFALYPGCFMYIKSDIEIKGSQRINQQISRNIQQLLTLLHKCQSHPQNSLASIHIHQHAIQIIFILNKFQNTLSENKKNILKIYKQLQNFFQSQYQLESFKPFTIQYFFCHPQTLRFELKNQFGTHQQLKNLVIYIANKIQPLILELQTILQSINPQPSQSHIQNLIYRIYSQKLYQIRFAYVFWQNKFDYNIYLVTPKKSNIILQCALIKRQKSQSQPTTNKAVLICCPNGAYIQFFALQSIYIKFYLDLGYQILLWNYRGYGQSTGSPSISTSMADIQTIYNYATSTLHLVPEIVHGYSIGGPPCVSLALSQNIKILVVDRTFCNFVNIAQQISPILAKLARIIMRADSRIKISDLYLKVKNIKKILIWSPTDEVISHASSLKLGILQHAYLQYDSNDSNSDNNTTSTIIQEQLVQINPFKSQDIINQTQTKLKYQSINKIDHWIKNFNYFFDILYEHELQQQSKKQINTNNKTTLSIAIQNQNNLLIQQLPVIQTPNSPTSTNPKIQTQIFQKFWKIFGYLDGAATTINFLKQLTKNSQDHLTLLHIQIRSFVLGLAFYGCCFKLNGQFQNIKFITTQHTLQNLTKVLQQFNTLLQQYNEKCTKQLIQYLKIFTTTLSQIKQFIQKQNKNIRKQIGIILSTNSGHNGQLSKLQMDYFKHILISNQNLDNHSS